MHWKAPNNRIFAFARYQGPRPLPAVLQASRGRTQVPVERPTDGAVSSTADVELLASRAIERTINVHHYSSRGETLQVLAHCLTRRSVYRVETHLHLPVRCVRLRKSRGRDDHRWAPPAQNRTGALTHTALTSDVWRRSVAGDRDAAPVGKESSDQEAVYAAATPPGHVDYDEPKRSATIAAADA